MGVIYQMFAGAVMLGKQAWEELVLAEADVWLVGVSMCGEGGSEEAGRKVWAREDFRSRYHGRSAGSLWRKDRQAGHKSYNIQEVLPGYVSRARNLWDGSSIVREVTAE